MKYGYALAARQQLAASPRLMQAVRLLQMSAQEFANELREALSSNAFLEEHEPGDGAHETGAPATIANTPEAPIIMDTMPIGASRRRNSGDGDDEQDVADWATAPVTLRDQLRGQLNGSPVSERERLAAEVVIETIDDDGYLRSPLEEAAAALELEQPLTAAELAAGLAVVQGFEPTGIAARDLGECLALQLAARDVEPALRELATRVAREYLQALARHDYATLIQQLGCSEALLHAADELIRKLDPRPGARVGADGIDYVVPDVIVQSVNGQWSAAVNPAVMPKIRLNQLYIDLLRRTRPRSHGAMRQQLQEARWLLRNAEQRFTTIQRVADTIVARQKAFFSYGEIALKPLVLREVADELGLHESTVSRATANKYMSTPRGLFEFKHFFSRQLATHTGGSCSAAAVQVLIKEMIAAEAPDAPLSDVALAGLLSEHGIRVARRTVTKYRTLMRVPPAELRRHA